jgi:microcystin-dependent protein
MEGTIGEIRLFASNFAPKNWAFCQGQTINIASNTALFSILGTVYGGNGTTNFQLPNLIGRSALGAGQGNGLSLYNVGAVAGTETVTLTPAQIPMHTHGVVVVPGNGGGATATLNAVNSPGTTSSPGGNFLAQDSGSSLATYASAGTPVAMKTGSVAVTSVSAPLPTVNVGMAGNNMAHNNIQPLLGLYYIICAYGVFPARN